MGNVQWKVLVEGLPEHLNNLENGPTKFLDMKKY